MAVPHQFGNQVEDALDLGCDGDDADVRPGRGDRVEDLAAGERRRRARPSGVRRQTSGCAPLKIGIDEIALEMRRQHAGGRRRARARAPRGSPASMRRSVVGPAGDRRRAERGDPVPRQPRRHRPDRITVGVERVDPFDAVHVDVDEAGDDVVAVEVASARRAAWATPRRSGRRPRPVRPARAGGRAARAWRPTGGSSASAHAASLTSGPGGVAPQLASVERQRGGVSGAEELPVHRASEAGTAGARRARRTR